MYIVRNFIVPIVLKMLIKFNLVFLYLTFVIALSFGSLTAAIFTILPPDGLGWTVSKPNYLGYYSVCSFAPFSTLILVGMALIGFFLLIKFGSVIKRKYVSFKNLIRMKMIVKSE